MDNDDYLEFAKQVIDLYEKGEIGAMGELINKVRLTTQKAPVAKLQCSDGLGAALQAATDEIRNLWVDIDEAIKLINEGKSHRAVVNLVRARKSSTRIAEKGGF